jgi:hypothetical protein
MLDQCMTFGMLSWVGGFIGSTSGFSSLDLQFCPKSRDVPLQSGQEAGICTYTVRESAEGLFCTAVIFLKYIQQLVICVYILLQKL